MLSLDRRVDIAVQLVWRARMQFEVFCIYGGEGEFHCIEEVVREEYHWFFKLQGHANRFSSLVEMAGLLTERKKTVNLASLVAEAHAVGSIDLIERERLVALLGSRPRVVKGVRKIRSRALAHRDDLLDFNDVFADAKITPNEVRALADDALTVANALCEARGRMQLTFNIDDLRRDAKRMFEALGVHFPKDNVSASLEAVLELAKQRRLAERRDQ